MNFNSSTAKFEKKILEKLKYLAKISMLDSKITLAS